MNNPSFTTIPRNYLRGDLPAEGDALTAVEHEVMGFLCEGLTNAEIAKERHTSSSTARYQVGVCLAKLGARNRTHAAAIYTRQKEGNGKWPMVS